MFLPVRVCLSAALSVNLMALLCLVCLVPISFAGRADRCADYPTKDYINRHINAYSNANLTTWAAAGTSPPLLAVFVDPLLTFYCAGLGNTFPKNSLIDTC